MYVHPIAFALVGGGLLLLLGGGLIFIVLWREDPYHWAGWLKKDGVIRFDAVLPPNSTGESYPIEDRPEP